MDDKRDLYKDLANSPVILEKVKDDVYAQHLYSALCNTVWYPNEVIPLLRQSEQDGWGCSWRSAGGFVASLRGEGDYLDWYCSGMVYGYDETTDRVKNSVPEGTISEEICRDLKELGWQGVDDDGRWC